MPPPNVPNKETVDFPHPVVVVDQMLTERSSSYVGTYAPVEPGQPYIPLNHSVAQAAQFAGLVSLSQKAGQDREFQERFWASDPKTQDLYNFSVEYSAKNTLLPIFKRKYLEKRDDYPALVRANLSVFTGIYGIRVTAGGTDYVKPVVTITDAGGGTGATAIALIDSNGVIRKITLKSEGQDYTSQTVITITDTAPGPGAGATAVATLQPPNCLLTEEAAQPAVDPWGSLYMEVNRTYESLPGDILFDIVPDATMGIPVMTTEQRWPSNVLWPCGKFAPVSFSITGATIATQTVVTTSAPHDFYVGEYAVIAGTANTTPTLNGTWEVVAVPSPTTVKLDKAITGVSGAVGGTVRRYSWVYIERRKTENSNVVLKVTTRAAVADITGFNYSTITPLQYSFPDALVAAVKTEDNSESSTTETTEYAFSYSFGGALGQQYQNGYRGNVWAVRRWIFSMGPFTSIPIDPDTGIAYQFTVIMPSSGRFTITGGSVSERLTTTGLTTSDSSSAKTEQISPCLTGAFPGITGSGGVGNNTTYAANLPDSVPTKFTLGDIILRHQDVVQLRGIEVYMWVVDKITVPYTTGTYPPSPLPVPTYP